MTRYVSKALRDFVWKRAFGRCEYCRIPSVAIAKHHIEHIIPLKHNGQTVEENLALSCPFCNEQKGTDVGSFDYNANGEFTMFFNPRTQVWSEHFLIEESGEIIPLTAEARVTERIFKLDDVERIEERCILIEAGIY